MERRYLLDGEPVSHERNEQHLEEGPYVRLVKRQRRGWYLIPNPIHNILRQFINGVVILLLASLFYLFVSPVLELLNIPVYGLDTVRWGLLDYPALAVFVVPLIFAPLLIRVLANLSELRRQNLFLKRNLQTPKIHFLQPSKADENLVLSVEFPEWDPTWNHVDAILRVGVLPPGRESLLRTLDIDPTRQPPPDSRPNSLTIGRRGSTTARRVARMHPWNSRKSRGSVSQTHAIDGSKRAPALERRGTSDTSTPFANMARIRQHRPFARPLGMHLPNRPSTRGALLWVQPLKVAHATAFSELGELPLHDGRSELDMT